MRSGMERFLKICFFFIMFLEVPGWNIICYIGKFDFFEFSSYCNSFVKSNFDKKFDKKISVKFTYFKTISLAVFNLLSDFFFMIFYLEFRALNVMRVFSVLFKKCYFCFRSISLVYDLSFQIVT